MSTILILEDEEYTLQYLKVLIENHPLVNQVIAINNSVDAINASKMNPPDIALIDIRLGENDNFNGIQTAKIITSISPHTIFVFVTAHMEYAIECFCVHPYYYLLKPVNRERLLDIITEIITQKVSSTVNKISLKCVEGTIIITPNAIACIEKSNKQSIIYTDQSTYHISCSLGNLEKVLPKQFLRVHNSYIVNLDKILMIKPTTSRSYQVTFDNCTAIATMSRNKYEECRQKLIKIQ